MKLLLYFIKKTLFVLSRLFKFSSYISLFSFLKILFTLKGLLGFLYNFMIRFAFKLHTLANFIKKIIKSDVTFLLTLSSIIKYFVHNYDLSKLYICLTVGPGLLALSALLTSTLQFHFYTVESFIIYFTELYDNMQDYYKIFLESIQKFLQDPVKYFLNIFTWLQELFSSDSSIEVNRTPEMPADLFLVDNNYSTGVNHSSVASSLSNSIDEPYSFKEWLASIFFSFILFLIFGTVVQTYVCDIGFPANDLIQSVKNTYSSTASNLTSLFQTIKLYFSHGGAPDAGVSPAIVDAANNLRATNVLTLLEQQQMVEALSKQKAASVSSSSVYSSGSSTPTARTVITTPDFSGSPVSEAGTVGYEHFYPIKPETKLEVLDTFTALTTPAVSSESVSGTNYLDILTEIEVEKSKDLMQFSPSVPSSSTSWFSNMPVFIKDSGGSNPNLNMKILNLPFNPLDASVEITEEVVTSTISTSSEIVVHSPSLRKPNAGIGVNSTGVAPWHSTREIVSVSSVCFNIASMSTNTRDKSQSKKYFNFSKKILKKNKKNIFINPTRLFSTSNNTSSDLPSPNSQLPIDWLSGNLMEFNPAEIRQNTRIKNAWLFIKDFKASITLENVFEVLLTTELFEVIFSEFWTRVMDKLQDSDYIILLIRINYTSNYSTLDRAIRVSKHDKESLLDHVSGILDLLSEEYRCDSVWGITLDYMIRENYDGKLIKDDFIVKKEKTSFPDKILTKETIKLSKYNLPLNNDYSSWGKVEYNSSDLLVVQDLNEQDKKYIINKLDMKTNRTTLEIKIKGVSILKFEDIIKNSRTLIRKINSTEYYIRNNEIFYKEIAYRTDTLRPIKTDKKLKNKILSLDLETVVLDNEHVPYCVCFYDGQEGFPFYLKDYPCPQDMLKTAIKSLLRSKYSGQSVYVHNLSRFDSIFLLNPLVDLSVNENIKIKPIFKNGSMIEIGIQYGPNNKYNLTIQDSYLLMPHSLKKLSVCFNVNHIKTSFPHKFLNNKYKNIDLNYVGGIPKKEFFSHDEEYTQFVQEYLASLENNTKSKKITKNNINKWSLRNEAIKYCLNDCISLHEVMVKYNEYIFNRFHLNIHGRPTAPSLSMAIFRACYLKKWEMQGVYIPLISGQTYVDIKKSYTGGSVDMYKPSNDEGELTFEYDRRSQFPSVMREGYYMPVITKKNKFIKYFDGNPLGDYMKPFGFFNVEVRTTRELEHPILQVRHRSVRNVEVSGSTKQNPTLRTISPLGNWTGMYFSEELYNSEKFGYEYDIKSGYIFEKCDIFQDFVKDLYEIKKAHSSEHPLHLISKLLLNSLYGRFGMDPNFESTAIINESEYESYLDKYEVLDCKTLNNGKNLITYRDKKKFSELLESNERAKNVSIPIASAITAYARVFMSQFKNNPNFRLYYTDTDAIYISVMLDPKWIGKDLGKFKLVNVFKRFIAPAPKLYGGITVEGQEIIKISGFKNKLSLEDLESLLIKDNTLELNQDVWFKNIEQGKITIKAQVYTAAVSESKRELIYNENNVLIGTKPFVINETSEE